MKEDINLGSHTLQIFQRHSQQIRPYFPAFFERTKHEAGVKRETRATGKAPSPVARVWRSSLASLVNGNWRKSLTVKVN